MSSKTSKTLKSHLDWDWKDEFTYYHSLFGGIIFVLAVLTMHIIPIFCMLFCLCMCLLQVTLEEKETEKIKTKEFYLDNPSRR